jgi:glycosyltransferase involved in cell wall biosynthesis
MKVSVIIPFLDSDEIVRRLIKYWGRMTLPDDIEFIIMDDGSEKPLRHPDFGLLDLIATFGLNMEIYETHEYRPWTSSIARNRGADIAKGRNLFMVDGDYIIPEQALLDAHAFTGNKMHMKRQLGVLDEDGVFSQDLEVLRKWGVPEDRLRRRGVNIPPHPNAFVMNKEVFLEIGGYDEERVLTNNYPQREDNHFKKKWLNWRNGKSHTDEYRPLIYMYPNGQFCGDVDYNPFGLFHKLSRKTKANFFWRKQREREEAAK